MASWQRRLREHFYRLAASGWVSPRWFLPDCPRPADLPGRTGRLRLEIVSHCWRYSHLLAYQLGSLVLYPPHDCDVRMTVFFSPEDAPTARLLDFFTRQSPANVAWNWWPIEKQRLFRRGLGRNLAAKATDADWIWLTDCDTLFQRDCLDELARQLQSRQDLLCFPLEEACTELLEQSDPILTAAAEPAVVDIEPGRFTSRTINRRAIGALQIMHGDVARRVGYCGAIAFYQQPLEKWQKTYEDRAIRWLLGTDGTPIQVPHVRRVEHAQKGRYHFSGVPAWLRPLVAGVRRATLFYRRGKAR